MNKIPDIKTIFHQTKIDILLRQMGRDIWIEQFDLDGQNRREIQAYLQHMTKYGMIEAEERVIRGQKRPMRFRLSERKQREVWGICKSAELV